MDKTPIPFDAHDHAEVAAKVRDRLAGATEGRDRLKTALRALCPSGPQGWHIYDIAQAGQPQIECMECGIPKTEMQILAELLQFEPPHGSIVLQDGAQGTAWQRFYGHGSWKSVTGRTSRWEAVVERSRPGSRVWLVYVPHTARQ